MKTEETLGDKIARVKEQYPDEIARTKAMMEWRMDDADFQRVFQGIRGDSHLPQRYTKGMATACLYAIEWAVNHGMLVPCELLLKDYEMSDTTTPTERPMIKDDLNTMDNDHDEQAARVDKALTRMFPEWEPDQRLAIAYTVVHAAAGITSCSSCAYECLPYD